MKWSPTLLMWTFPILIVVVIYLVAINSNEPKEEPPVSNNDQTQTDQAQKPEDRGIRIPPRQVTERRAETTPRTIPVMVTKVQTVKEQTQQTQRTEQMARTSKNREIQRLEKRR